MPDDQIMREAIESRRDDMTAGPTEGYDQLEQKVQEEEQEARQRPDWSQGTEQRQDVPEDERLQRPVATETDSY